MGLETPLALLALAAGLLPILAHRIRRRDLPVLSLPTFALLNAAQASQRQRRDLGDFLLLAVRIALLCLLALALAAPYVVTRVAFGDGQVSSVALVIDDSMSMKQVAGGETLLTRALQRADSALTSLPQGSQAALVLAGKRPRLLAPMTKDLALLRRRLQEIVPSDRGTDLTSAVHIASQALLASQVGKRRLLILSDFARHAEFDKMIFDDSILVSAERIESEHDTSNLYFSQILATPDPAIKDHTALSIKVTATGDAPAQVHVRVRGGDGKAISTPLDFHGQDAQLTLSVVTPQRDQDPCIELAIENEDALAADNHYEVLIDRSDALRLLLVNGDPQPGMNRDELYYLQKALPLIPSQAQSFRVHAIDAASLSREDLTQCDVVVLANVAAPEPEVVHGLQEFVQSGGGILISGGDQVEPSAYNERMAALLPGHLSATRRSSVHFGELEKAGFLPEGLTGLQLVDVTAHLLVDTEQAPVAKFSDGSSAVSVKSLGRGHVVLFASTLDADWTDLPLRPGYLAFSAAMLHLAAGERATFTGHYAPGDSVALPVPAGARTLEIVSPSGELYRLDAGHEPTLNFAQTLEAGGYRVLASAGASELRFIRERSFSVDTNPEESDLRQGPMPSLGEGSTVANASLDVVHHDISPILWLLAGVLVAAEAFLRRRRPVSPPPPPA